MSKASSKHIASLRHRQTDRSAAQILAARDPVVALAIRLGEAWADNDRAQARQAAAEIGCVRTADADAEAEAYARVTAIELMISVTTPQSIAGACIKQTLCYANIHELYRPQDDDTVEAEIAARDFDTEMRALKSARDALVRLAQIDLRALGIGNYLTDDEARIGGAV